MIYLGYIAALLCGFLTAYLIFRRRGRTSGENSSAGTGASGKDTVVVDTAEDKLATTLESLRVARHELNNLHLVNELSEKITASLSLEESFHQIHATLNSMMDAAVVELKVRYGDDTAELYFSNLKKRSEDDHQNHMIEWTFANNRVIYLPDAENDYGRYVYEPLILPEQRHAGSVITFPVNDSGEVIGVLSVISYRKHAFENFHKDMIGQLIPFVAVAIKNAYNHLEIIKLKQRAEQSEEFMQQFLANMSHEIRTPIHAVTGMTQLLLDKHPADEQVKYLESIKNASETLMSIINDILDLSKIEANKLEVESIDFSLGEVLNNIRDLMELKAKEKNIELKVSVDPQIAPFLKGDPVRITQVMLNLIGNAIKFTESGSVLVSVDLNPGKKAKSNEVNDLFLSVTDTGIGMTQEQQKKLFQKYTQVSSDTSRKYGGTGLGLSIARSLVDLMGGTLQMKSEYGKGSTFFFRLKLPSGDDPGSHGSSLTIKNEEIQKLDGLRVLIVDDNEYNRTVARESLEIKISNINVDEATGGEQALDLMERKDYDIILLDLVMPGMNGYEVADRIRKGIPPPRGKTPVIALTASAVRDEIGKCRKAGMNGFLPKPFKATDLIRTIYQVLIDDSQIPESSETKNERTLNGNSVIDISVLDDYMERDVERMKRQLDQFIRKVPEHLSQIRSALELNDKEKARIAAHSMKPLLTMLGINEGLKIASGIEQKCRSAVEVNILISELDTLDSICEKALTEIRLVDLYQKD